MSGTWTELVKAPRRRRPWYECLADAWYFVRCHTYNRYHIINLSGQDDYRWGWLDRDRAMLLACFKLLVDFVEGEDPEVGRRTVDDYCNHAPEMDCAFQHACVEQQLEGDAEIRALYDWWTVGRAQEHAAAEASGWTSPNPLVLDERDQEQLERLIVVRQRLWT